MTCEDCYWFSDVLGVPMCEHEHDPTTPDSPACDIFEDKSGDSQ